MTINAHLTEFGGLPILNFEGTLEQVGTHAYRVAVDYDEDEAAWPGDEGQSLWERKFAALLRLPEAAQLRGLVTGATTEDDPSETMSEALPSLLAAAPQLPALESLFLNDLIAEECEISWIQMQSLAPLLAAFPNLRHLGVRGSSEGLMFGALHLPHLETLVIQSGGLPREVVSEVLAADLPELRHLELYFGSENYGATTTIADLAPLLRGDLFPKLKVLGLKNAEFSDEIAAATAHSPLLSRLDVLDLSLGMLTDEGAQALLESGTATHLKTLDLSYHYLTDDMQTRIQAAFPGTTLLLDDPQDVNDEWRSVAISE
ncbi:STM4015 family protein [Deinococcus sp. KNUC1210]|uniref:STM4015 family protein n=1 Tax=Deinococcus sp. KNUC1210 TaxID=2917691 RepID=UPI001EF0C016|nr:STM4015 family protein [Deinococcus sp. KNUC1210]ULH16175.1 STM4015 family protein [Deinococcus sp. KNUC1210]